MSLDKEDSISHMGVESRSIGSLRAGSAESTNLKRLRPRHRAGNIDSDSNSDSTSTPAIPYA